jgi:hypothetical protein
MYLGRWLNVSLVGLAGGKGFPEVKLTVGPVTFPAAISRFFLEAGRLTVNVVGANVPSLDQLVMNSDIANGTAMATVNLPAKTGIFDVMGGGMSRDTLAVRSAYCRLAEWQARSPSDDFHVLVHRAFPEKSAGASTATTNRAGLVSLAMMTVSPRVGALVGLSDDDLSACSAKVGDFKLKGRSDLSKHWSISAALAVTTGTQLSEAIGEWKELSDSVSSQSEFSRGDPTGFSFLDLAADRSGFLVGQSAVNGGSAEDFAMRMAHVSEEALLPSQLMAVEDGMPASEFKRKYGSIRDPRYVARIKQIDAILFRQGPLANSAGY